MAEKTKGNQEKGGRASSSSSSSSRESIFIRNATGLVREVSLFDAFVFNLAANPIGLALVFILGFQIGLFPGANPIVAMILVAVVALFIAATYALFSAAFPRSGGDYVFNSRVLHPAVGFGFNLSLSFWEWLTASLSLSFITTLGLSPVTVMIGYFAKTPSLVNLGIALSNPIDVLVIGTIFNAIISSLFLVGTKRTIRFINGFYIASFAGLVLIVIALLASSPALFQNNLNNFLHQIGSNQTYSGIIATARSGGMTLPSSISSKEGLALLPAMMGVVSIEAIWFFWSSYIGGEVKRASSLRRQLVSMLGSAAFNAVVTLIAIVLYLSVMGKDFITSFSYLLSFAPSAVPFSPATVSGDQIVVFASLATNNSILAILIPLLFIGWSIVVVVDFAMQPVRSVFAWSMDRVIPARFARVSERFHAPVYPVLLGAAIMEAGLVAQVLIPSAVFLIFTASIAAPAFSSMFLTGVSGVILPFRGRRNKTSINSLYSTSGLGKYRVGRVPIISITGGVTAGYIIFLLIVFFSYGNFGLQSPLLGFLALGLNLVGIAIYFLSREFRRRREGIDIGMAFSEIPPE